MGRLLLAWIGTFFEGAERGLQELQARRWMRRYPAPLRRQDARWFGSRPAPPLSDWGIFCGRLCTALVIAGVVLVVAATMSFILTPESWLSAPAGFLASPPSGSHGCPVIGRSRARLEWPLVTRLESHPSSTALVRTGGASFNCDTPCRIVTQRGSSLSVRFHRAGFDDDLRTVMAGEQAEAWLRWSKGKKW